MIKIDENVLSKIIKEEVNNTIDNVLLRIRLEMLPQVSDEEQKELEKLFGETPPKLGGDDFVS